jgi:hypothetical protein
MHAQSSPKLARRSCPPTLPQPPQQHPGGSTRPVEPHTHPVVQLQLQPLVHHPLTTPSPAPRVSTLQTHSAVSSVAPQPVVAAALTRPLGRDHTQLGPGTHLLTPLAHVSSHSAATAPSASTAPATAALLTARSAGGRVVLEPLAVPPAAMAARVTPLSHRHGPFATTSATGGGSGALQQAGRGPGSQHTAPSSTNPSLSSASSSQHRSLTDLLRNRP